MLDQAETLRTLVRDKVYFSGPVPHPPNFYTVAVTSGKGGVGKTTIAVNLALLLSKAGRRVRLVDADFGLSNAEVLMGMNPKRSLNDVLRGGIDPWDAWTDGPGGIKLLSSGSGLEEMANIDGTIGVTLINHVLQTASDGDVVIIDTAPGINDSVISLLTFADEVMVVTSPEPTSITDSYAVMKVLINKNPAANITLIANSCTSPSQATCVADGLNNICRKFLGRSFQRYEYLPDDASVGWAIRTQKPLAISNNHSAIGPWLRKIAIKMDDRIRKQGAQIEPLAELVVA